MAKVKQTRERKYPSKAEVIKTAGFETKTDKIREITPVLSDLFSGFILSVDRNADSNPPKKAARMSDIITICKFVRGLIFLFFDFFC